MELDFIKQLSKETFGYLYIAATRLSQKYAGYFSIAKENFSLPLPRLQIGFPAIFAEKQEIWFLQINRKKSNCFGSQKKEDAMKH